MHAYTIVDGRLCRLEISDSQIGWHPVPAITEWSVIGTTLYVNGEAKIADPEDGDCWVDPELAEVAS